MDYLLSFLEGIITFISPCLLPMLPIYISYFAGEKSESKSSKSIINSIFFVLGFTLIFIILGAFAGIVGGYLIRYKEWFNIVSGLIIISFGLSYLDIIKLKFFNLNKYFNIKYNFGILSSFLFGIVFSFCWTPCVGAFLGTALTLAAQSGNSIKGILMLLFYSLGLGIPFIVTAILLDKLKSTFDFIKKNHNIIRISSGILLILIGILTATGFLGYFLSLLTF